MSGAPADPSRVEAGREAVTMALYVSLTLLAVLLATPPPDAGADQVQEALRVLLTSVALIVAHQVAFRISDRLTHGGAVQPETLALIRAQSAGGLAVAVTASIPPLVLGGELGLLVAELLLLGFVCAVGYVAIRRGNAGRVTAWLYVLGLIAVVVMVVALKLLVK